MSGLQKQRAQKRVIQLRCDETSVHCARVRAEEDCAHGRDVPAL